MRSSRECAPGAMFPRLPSPGPASHATRRGRSERTPRRALRAAPRVHMRTPPQAHTSPRRAAGGPASSVHGLCRSIENELVEIEIEPAAELEAGVPDTAAELESESLVERDADVVGGIDAANHVVILLFSRSRDERLEQQFPDAPSTAVLVHVDRVLDGVLVGRPVSEWAVRREPEQTVLIVDRADHRILPLLLGIEPACHHRHGARTVVVERRRMLDRFVQDRENLLRPAAITVDQSHAHVSGGSPRPYFDARAHAPGPGVPHWRRLPAR